ncbi:MAG TPA: PD-(D/E)XK motif protein [Candidatus Scybalomonas excrementigallinarum]|nr:PD-(D/E)XK motif protein [Candidatus Scybalomonas excrementigallinarum]
MNILEEIREYFASKRNGMRDIISLSEEYPAMVIRDGEEYGVAIIYNNEKEILEKFSNSRLYTKEIFINGKENKYLILSCMLENLRYEFATVCAQFIEPGDNGINRKHLLQDPLDWWKQWKELMGNTISEQQVYNIIAEMIVLEQLYREDHTVQWTALNSGSHDIEGDTGSYEVKSTIKKYETTITIAGQHQLRSIKRLQLYFCRLEKSREGVSINDMAEKLTLNGYDKEKLEQQLCKLGYEKGGSVRDEKYVVLEKRKYEVDDKFPKIVESSFKGNKIPDSVLHITYTIDLGGLDYTVW